MLELPEVLSRAGELRGNIVGKTIERVLPPSKPHKFCWYNGDPAAYHQNMAGKRVTGAEGFGIYVELSLEGGSGLLLNDGVNMRLVPVEKAPKNYQLLVEFTDRTALVFTVAMYGGIFLHEGSYENEYYLKSRQAPVPFEPEFGAYFHEKRTESKPTLSVKAFLATEQRFPGIGNGVLQDILFEAGINPRRKLETLTDQEWEKLFSSVVSVLRAMTDAGGRDTEKNLFGEPGEYRTIMSRNTLAAGCPACGGAIIKETYLGGSVYYCSVCQP